MTKVLQAAMLNLLGLAIVSITLSGTYLSYVKESMKWPLLATGACLVVLAVTWFVDAVRDSRASSHDDVHVHDHGTTLSAWLLLVPGVVLFFAAPPALGAYDAARATGNDIPVVVSEDYEKPLPAGDPVPLTLTDFVIRSVSQEGSTIEGREVSLVGFVTPDPEGGWWLARQSIACCAADAQPVRIRVIDAPADWAAPAADTWVHLTGTWQPQSLALAGNAVPIPSVRVSQIDAIEPPENPYE